MFEGEIVCLTSTSALWATVQEHLESLWKSGHIAWEFGWAVKADVLCIGFRHDLGLQMQN